MAPMAPRTTGEAAPTTARGTVRPRRGRSRCATSAGCWRSARPRAGASGSKAAREWSAWSTGTRTPPPPSLLLPLPVSLLYTPSRSASRCALHALQPGQARLRAAPAPVPPLRAPGARPLEPFPPLMRSARRAPGPGNARGRRERRVDIPRPARPLRAARRRAARRGVVAARPRMAPMAPMAPMVPMVPMGRAPFAPMPPRARARRAAPRRAAR